MFADVSSSRECPALERCRRRALVTPTGKRRPFTASLAGPRLPGGLAVFICSACAVAPAPPPTLPVHGDEAVRTAAYRDYSLRYENTWSSESWKRGENEYPFAALRELALASPEVLELYQRAEARRMTINSIVVVGGSTVALNWFYNRSVDQEDAMSPPAEQTVYLVGGSVMLLGAIVASLWNGQEQAFTDAYNEYLRSELELRPRISRHNSSWTPKLHERGLSWQF